MALAIAGKVRRLPVALLALLMLARLHHEIGAPHRLIVRARQSDDGESQEDTHRADPPDRGSDMRGEREIPQERPHDHGAALASMNERA
jgi:hypothetical protein